MGIFYSLDNNTMQTDTILRRVLHNLVSQYNISFDDPLIIVPENSEESRVIKDICLNINCFKDENGDYISRVCRRLMIYGFENLLCRLCEILMEDGNISYGTIITFLTLVSEIIAKYMLNTKLEYQFLIFNTACALCIGIFEKNFLPWIIENGGWMKALEIPQKDKFSWLTSTKFKFFIFLIFMTFDFIIWKKYHKKV